MKFSKKSLGFILSLVFISYQVIGLNTAALASSTVTPVADSAAPKGAVTKVMVTFKGDTTTSKGFNWYTSTASINSDLQVVEKKSHKQVCLRLTKTPGGHEQFVITNCFAKIKIKLILLALVCHRC